MISLDELLAARDARHEKQLSLLREHPDQTLVCLTVIMPGSEKRNALSLAVANAAVGALRSAFPDSEIETCDLETGFEAYLLVPLPAQTPAGSLTNAELEAKRIAVGIEDTHPLGRLFDIDVLHRVFSPSETSSSPSETASSHFSSQASPSEILVDAVPLSRSAVGSPPRRCLLCEREARLCMRQHTHTHEELMTRIQQLVASYDAGA